MFPIGVIVATIAMMSGIGGALFFSPLFLLILGFDSRTILGLSLLIEIFGFSSGVVGYLRTGCINFGVVKKLILPSLFITILGVSVASFIPSFILKLILVSLLFIIAYNLFTGRKKCDAKIPPNKKVKKKSDIKVTRGVFATTMFGAALIGMVSSGLGLISEYNFLKKLKLPVVSASGTSVFMVASNAIVGVAVHSYIIIREGNIAVFGQLWPILIFTIPGVIIGAQIGVLLSRKVKLSFMELFVGSLFTILGAITLYTIV